MLKGRLGFFNNESGMSLVSVTIAAGIMGMIALAMMRMQDNQLKTQNDMVIRNEIMLFMNKLSNYLSKDDYCEVNFEGMKINESSSIRLEKIVNPLKRVLYQTGEKYGNNSFKLLSITQKEFFYDQEDNNSGVLKLNVSMEKSKKATGAKIINKELEVFLFFNPDKEVYACGDGAGLTATLGADPGIDAEEIKKTILEAAKTGDSPVTFKGTTVSPSDNSGGSEAQKQAKLKREMQEAMENNPTLKLLKSTIENIERSNKEFKELEEKHLREAGQFRRK